MSKKEQIKVFTRFRPSGKIHSHIKIPSKKTLLIKKDYETKQFDFNYIFDYKIKKNSEKEIFEKISKEILENVIKGFNGSIMAFGQTGSGKTYTIVNEILPQCINFFLEHKKISEENKIYFSAVQIYNEKISDLITNEKNLKIREDLKKGFFIENEHYVEITNFLQIKKIIKETEQNREIGSTSMNLFSSRSHAIYKFKIIQKKLNLVSELNLVDLSGSERLKKMEISNFQYNETISINSSLTILSKCIINISDKKKYIPFRESKLTKLLMKSLNGNSLTNLIINISPDFEDLEESLSSLNFGQRACKIENEVFLNFGENGKNEEKKIFEMKKKIFDLEFKLGNLKNERNEILQKNFFLEKEKEILGKNENFEILEFEELKRKFEEVKNKYRNLQDFLQRNNYGSFKESSFDNSMRLDLLSCKYNSNNKNFENEKNFENLKNLNFEKNELNLKIQKSYENFRNLKKNENLKNLSYENFVNLKKDESVENRISLEQEKLDKFPEINNFQNYQKFEKFETFQKNKENNNLENTEKIDILKKQVKKLKEENEKLLEEFLTNDFQSEKNDMNLFKKLNTKNIEIENLQKKIKEDKEKIFNLENSEKILLEEKNDFLEEIENLEKKIFEIKKKNLRKNKKRESTPLKKKKNSYSNLYSKRVIKKSESFILKKEIEENEIKNKLIFENFKEKNFILENEKNELLLKIDEILNEGVLQKKNFDIEKKNIFENFEFEKNEIFENFEKNKKNFEILEKNFKNEKNLLEETIEEKIFENEEILEEVQILREKYEKITKEINEVKFERNFINENYLKEISKNKKISELLENCEKLKNCENCENFEKMQKKIKNDFFESEQIFKIEKKRLEEENEIFFENNKKLEKDKKRFLEDNENLAKKLFSLEDILGKKDIILIKKKENMDIIVKRFINNIKENFEKKNKKKKNFENFEKKNFENEINFLLNFLKNEKTENLIKKKKIYENLLKFLINPKKLIESFKTNFNNENIVLNQILNSFENFFENLKKKLKILSEIILKEISKKKKKKIIF